jgi:hypothetical protein
MIHNAVLTELARQGRPKLNFLQWLAGGSDSDWMDDLDEEGRRVVTGMIRRWDDPPQEDQIEAAIRRLSGPRRSGNLQEVRHE